MNNNSWSFDNFVPGGSEHVPSTEDIIRGVKYQCQQETEQLKYQHSVQLEEQKIHYQQEFESVRQEYLK